MPQDVDDNRGKTYNQRNWRDRVDDAAGAVGNGASYASGGIAGAAGGLGNVAAGGAQAAYQVSSTVAQGATSLGGYVLGGIAGAAANGAMYLANGAAAAGQFVGDTYLKVKDGQSSALAQIQDGFQDPNAT